MNSQSEQGLPDGDDSRETEQFLSFLLAGEEYGIDILQVQEIRGWQPVTPIPNTPDFIKGVMNLRGSIVPIVDLRIRFDIDGVEYTPTTVVIVLHFKSQAGERTVGIVVDAVSEVYDLTLDDLKPPPELGGAISTKYMRGLATVDDKMVILLDITGLIDMEILKAVDGQAAEMAEEHDINKE